MKNTKQKRNKIYNLIILDESGSMQSIKSETISGFNEIVQTIKAASEKFPEQDHCVSFVSFNTGGIKTHLDRMPVDKLKAINGNIYRPNECTPLFDAIGTSALHLKNALGDEVSYNVLVTVLTDGLENASREFSLEQIKSLIEELRKKGWTFTYIGADHDVEKVAMSISIENTITFEKDPQSMKKMFAREQNSRISYSQKIRDNKSVDKDYFIKEDEEKDKPAEK